MVTKALMVTSGQTGVWGQLYSKDKSPRAQVLRPQGNVIEEDAAVVMAHSLHHSNDGVALVEGVQLRVKD